MRLSLGNALAVRKVRLPLGRAFAVGKVRLPLGSAFAVAALATFAVEECEIGTLVPNYKFEVCLEEMCANCQSRSRDLTGSCAALSAKLAIALTALFLTQNNIADSAVTRCWVSTRLVLSYLGRPFRPLTSTGPHSLSGSAPISLSYTAANSRRAVAVTTRSRSERRPGNACPFRE